MAKIRETKKSTEEILWESANKLRGNVEPSEYKHNVGGKLGWDNFYDMQFQAPSLPKQKEIIKKYETITNRIKLNKQLTQKLESTAQTIYKEWFVNFEFPNKEGKPYKSSGGKMIYNDELDMEVPEGWEISSLSKIATYLNGLAMQKYETHVKEFLPVLKIRELNQGYTDEDSGKASLETPKDYIINNGDIIFSWSASLKVDIWVGGICGLNQHLFKVTSKKYEKWFYYLWTKYHLMEFIRITEGNKIKREHLDNAIVFIPSKNKLKKMNKIMYPIINDIILTKEEKSKLVEFSKILLSEIATMEK